MQSTEESLRNNVPVKYDYIIDILNLLLCEDCIDTVIKERISHEMQKPESIGVFSINRIRNDLLNSQGILPADWDFFSPLGVSLASEARTIFKGMNIFLDDIRSPFNIGSILRSADAFGVENVFMSPFCASPLHPRALRTSMGTSEIISYKTLSVRELALEKNIFALELGGTSIEEFQFPKQGIAIIGSEELGVSPEALALCGDNKVSIPMYGAKASINVGVATGVLLHAWSLSLSK